MSIVTTITNLISYGYPENAYVRFFGRVLDYNPKSGILSVQELPAFNVNTELVSSCSTTQKDNDSTLMQPLPSSSSSRNKNELGKGVQKQTYLQLKDNPPSDDDLRQNLPVALVHIKDELIPESGLTLSHDIIKGCLIVDVMARLRAKEEREGDLSNERPKQHKEGEDNDGCQNENDCEDDDDDTIRDSDTSVTSDSDGDGGDDDNKGATTEKSNSLPMTSSHIDVEYISVSKLDEQSLFDNANSEIVEAFLKKVCFVRESIALKHLDDS